MQVFKAQQQPSETLMSEQLLTSGFVPLAAEGGDVVHDPYEKEQILGDADKMSGSQSNHQGDDHHHEHPVGQSIHGASVELPDGPVLLWTEAEETVLQHTSEASLKHIRTRLEHLLLGVSHALRIRETRRDSLDPHETRPGGAGAGSTRQSRSRPSLDFAEMVLAADHAIRRIMGEAFSSYKEDEIMQMVQLSALADRGPADCDELARNAVVVLQALTHDGDAVRSLEHFRQFVDKHRTEMASEQWRHDYVTAMRSLAVGFLRQPVAIMASYGSSLNQIVEHESLYIGLLRLCGGRPVGNTPHPKELPSTLDEALLGLHRGPKPSQGISPTEARRATKAEAAKPRTRSVSAAKHSLTYIHTPKNASKRTHARRLSTAPQQPTLPPANDLQTAIGLLMSSGSSSPTSPAKKAASPQDGASGVPPSQPHELQKSASNTDLQMAWERRVSASHARTEKLKPAYEPVPEAPRRLSLHRGCSPSMSHY